MNRDFLWVAGGRIVTAVASLLAIKVATSILSPNQYGVLAILITFQVFCGLFLVNPVGQYINRKTHEWTDDGTLLTHLRSYRLYILCVGVIGFFVSGFWSLGQPVSWCARLVFMCSVGGMVISATWNATSISLLNMIGYRAESAFCGVLTVVISLVASICMVWISRGGVTWFIGQAFGSAFGAVYAGYLLRKKLQCTRSCSKPFLNHHAVQSYILPLAIATGFMWWLISGYRLIVERLWGLEALGYMAVGMTFSSQLWGVFESLAVQFLFPLYYRRISKSERRCGIDAFSDLLNVLIPLYIVIASLALLSAPSLVKIFISSAYTSVVDFFQIGCIIEMSRVGANALSNAAQVDGKMKSLIIPYATGAFIVTAGLLVIAHIGLEPVHAAIVVAISGVAMLGVMAWYMHRDLPFLVDKKRFSASGLIFLMSAIVAVKLPLSVASMSSAILLILVAGLIAIIFTFLLLWKNPAVLRLVTTPLKIETEE